MLSFELSAIDLILAIAVVTLLILYMTKLSARPVVQEKSRFKEEIPPEKPAITVTSLKTEEETPSQTPPLSFPATSPATLPPAPPPGACPYNFGYLKKLGDSAPVPDECLSCPRIVDCYGQGE